MGMRPTNDELLVGIRNVLDDVLVPELQSDWAKSMGDSMYLMLGHLIGRTEKEPSHLRDANRRLEEVIGRANESLGPAKVEVPPAVDESDLEALWSRNGALRDAVTAAIEAAYEQGDYGFNDLPTERLGIGNDLLGVLQGDLAFWQPIGFWRRPIGAMAADKD